jgi:hypothetical protein
VPEVDGSQISLGIGKFASQRQLQEWLHIGPPQLRRLLTDEDTVVFSVMTRTGRCFSYLWWGDAEDQWGRHGSDAARAARLARSPFQRKLPPLVQTCPHCFDTEKQRRGGRNAKGYPRVVCGNCGRQWLIGRRPPLVAQCPRCGERSRQLRSGGVSTAGNREALCGYCRKHYMLDGDPDEELRKWYEKELGMPIPENWWAPEWQSKPISEWPGYDEAMRKLENEANRRNRR